MADSSELGSDVKPWEDGLLAGWGPMTIIKKTAVGIHNVLSQDLTALPFDLTPNSKSPDPLESSLAGSDTALAARQIFPNEFREICLG